VKAAPTVPTYVDTGDHEIEIETREPHGGIRLTRRCSCSCGFVGPWRLKPRTARRDADAHLCRREEGLA
jgi:hypothetical protein